MVPQKICVPQSIVPVLLFKISEYLAFFKPITIANSQIPKAKYLCIFYCSYYILWPDKIKLTLTEWNFNALCFGFLLTDRLVCGYFLTVFVKPNMVLGIEWIMWVLNASSDTSPYSNDGCRLQQGEELWVWIRLEMLLLQGAFETKTQLFITCCYALCWRQFCSHQ